MNEVQPPPFEPLTTGHGHLQDREGATRDTIQRGGGKDRMAEPLSSEDKVTFELDPEPCRRPSQETKGWRVRGAMTC